MDENTLRIMINKVLAGAGYEIAGWRVDTRTQFEDATQEVKGKMESAGGDLKDAVRDATISLSAWPEAGEKASSRHREAALAGDGKIL